MDFLDVVRRRKTTNGAFLPDPVSDEHQRLLIEVASRAPSQLNSQPWRFVLIDDHATIDAIADVSGASMTAALAEGTFFERYRPYFRFSNAEMEEKRSGMHFDRLPAPLRPFTRTVFTAAGQSIMNALRVPQSLGAQNRALVAGSPLLLGVLLDRSEYRPGELSAFYSVFSMGAAMENIWLATVELGMGIQFISFPMEVPGKWAILERLLEVPDDLELMAIYRLGYLPPDQRRPAIDWSSHERMRPSQFVYRGTLSNPETRWD